MKTAATLHHDQSKLPIMADRKDEMDDFGPSKAIEGFREMRVAREEVVRPVDFVEPRSTCK